MARVSSHVRTRLVHAGLKLFSTRGYFDTSIEDILRESGCTKGTLYYHFSSKEELGYAVVDEELRLLVGAGALSYLQSNEHPIDRLLRLVDDVPSTVELETGGSVELGIAARMAAVHEGFRQRLMASVGPVYEQFERMVAEGIADGQIADTVDPVQLTHFAMVVTHGLQMARQLGQERLLPDRAKGWIREYLNSLRT